MSEWTTYRLGDVCSKIGSGATPRGGSGVYLEQGEYALIRSQNIYNEGFHHDGLAYLTQKHADELSNVEVQSGDVLLNITGDSVARSCQVDTDILPARVNQHVAIIRPDPKKLAPRFLRYYLVSPAMQSHMLSLAGAGATRNALTKGMIEAFELVGPSDLGEQQAIACILGALDDKIELNRRRNRTLEAMARAIFQSWFVDFDPVRAKAEGRKPAGLSKEVAALFPKEFEESELGEIPKGWRVGTLSDCAGFVLGGDWGKDMASTEIPTPAYCIRGADIPDLQAGGLGEMPVRYLKESSLEKRSLRDGDLVIEISGGSPTQSTGRPVLVTSGLLDSIENPLTCSNFCRLFRPSTPIYSEYLYLLMRWYYDRDTFLQYENGTTGIKNFAFAKFADSHPLLLPDEHVLEGFATIIKPFFTQRQQLGKESRTLAALRDALLPKLISGELRVPDAERIVGRVM